VPEAFAVQLVSPEQVLFEGDAEMVVCRPTDGEIAFLYGHVPYLGALTDDVVRILFPGSGELAAAVHGGFVQMTGDHLVVLSDVAELAEQIDVARAERARAAAEETLVRDPDDEAAVAALRRAEVRLRVAAGSAAAH
jgi:F-type H+-transporting ATPase subunit epsilon